jgi:hypothetical protein
VFLAQVLLEDVEIEATALAPDDSVAATSLDTATAGMDEIGTDFYVQDVVAWSPAAPNLYRLKVLLRRKGDVLDRYEDNFGFRTIETRNGRLHLNGEPFYLRGALDQDYYPDTICTTPSIEFLEDQFRKAKELGLNCLRLHIKAPDPLYFEVADRLGMLVWAELPNGGLTTERSRARKEATLKGIVDRDGNHPSIIIWTIINENWGVDLVHDAEHRRWLKRTYHWLKSYDPVRLVVDNSPLSPSFHVETDVADYHFYAAYPDSRFLWDQFVDGLADRASWLYSPEGDAVQTRQEPLMCSEFGNWGLPDPEDLRNADRSEPWWFETGHDWGEGIMYPHGVENRFLDWSLDRVFGRLRDFVEAAQWQQFNALKYEIETMRRRASIAGYVITELTDCHWESNGLLDMRRNPRVFHGRFGTINADTVIVPDLERRAYWAGETIRLSLTLAHGAGREIVDGRLVVRFGEAAIELKVPALAPGTVGSLPTVELDVPELQRHRLEPVKMELYTHDGRVIASNLLELALHPRRVCPGQAGPLWSPSPDIRSRLAVLGYPLASSMEDAALVVATDNAPDLAAYVRSGGRLVLLPDSPASLNPFFPHWQSVKVQGRLGTQWQGDWASSFSWLRRSRAFATLPGGPLLDATFDGVIPIHVISGCNLLDFQGRVHAGLVVGWIHKPVALTVERSYGNGRVAISTFRLLEDAPHHDPTATLLLDALINLAGAAPQRDERAAEALEFTSQT